MSWMLVLAATWLLLSLPLALLLGRMIRVVDQRSAATPPPVVPDFVPASWTAFRADSH
jgi:hypothetical protein